MFKETFERGEGEKHVEKSALEIKLDQLTLMRRKKATLEAQMKIPVPVDEAKRIEKEYKDITELVSQIETDFETLKLERQNALEAKFEITPEAANDSKTFEDGLMQSNDRMDRRG